MLGRSFCLVCLAGLALFATMVSAGCTDSVPPWELPPVPQLCGMNITNSRNDGADYGTPRSAQVLDDLAGRHISLVGMNVPLRMETATSVVVSEHPRQPLDQLRDGLALDVNAAKALGQAVLLSAHLDLMDDSSRGEIQPAGSAGGWPSWFASYGAQMRRIAELAEALGVDALCVGLELGSSTRAAPERWVTLIAELRRVFSGLLLYCANWDEATEIPFWDRLDRIGVQMYAPLATGAAPSLQALRAGARDWLGYFADLAARHQKRLWLTEVGFANRPGTAERPWEWPESLGPLPVTAAGDAAQAAAYQAIFETFGRAPQVEAMLWWQWLIDPQIQPTVSFSPQGRPAEQVVTDFCRVAE